MRRLSSLAPCRWKRALCAWVVFFGATIASAVDRHQTWQPMTDWYTWHYEGESLLPPHLEYSELRISLGDDPQWAQPDWNDSLWRRIPFQQIPQRRGVMWVRFRVRDPTATIPGLIHTILGAAHELYWDGVLIGRSGVPANDAATEQPGKLRCYYTVPESMRAPGEHVIAVRLSNHRAPAYGQNGQFAVIITSPAEFEVFRWRILAGPVMQVGTMLVFALAAVLMWGVAARRPMLLLFAGFCLGLALVPAGFIAEYTISRPYDLWPFRGTIVTAPTCVCLVALMATQLGLPRVRWLVAGFAFILTFVVFGNLYRLSAVPNLMMSASIATALGCALFAIGRKRRGAWIAVSGLFVTALLLFPNPMEFMRTGMFLGMLPTVLSVLAVVAVDVRDEQRRARDAKLTAARLEIELLKKNLQPHFLMNTLTALAQTVEENPAGAVQLIDDLAAEVRMLATISAEPQVPLGRELELCRAHLRVMRARTDLDWQLDAQGVDEAACVPPALFLTLIENGFAHQRARRDATTFRLRARLEKGATCYTMFSPGVVADGGARVEGGTGLRYVRARLEESFPAAWKLSHGPSEGGWATVIELRDPPRHGLAP